MGMILKRAGASALGLALGAAIIMAQPVSAAVYDFAALASTAKGTDTSANTAGTTAGVEKNWSDYFLSTSGKWTPTGGVGVTATGFNSNSSLASTDPNYINPAAVDAFLDVGTWAGLGVCSNLAIPGGYPGCSTGATGARTSDDNVNFYPNGGYESVKLTFDSAVKITDIKFGSADNTAHTGTLLIDDGAGAKRYGVSGGSIVAGGFIPAIGTMFTFIYDSTSVSCDSTCANGVTRSTKEFYVNTLTASAVPLPAGVLLLGSALGGLGLMKRRRKAA